MAEANNQTTLPPLVVEGQFIKDLSFEAPNAPEIFKQIANKENNISLSVNVNIDDLGEGRHLVSSKYSVTSTVEDKTLFILELEYSCSVRLAVEEKLVQPMLLIEVPRLMFPFARAIISSTTREGGFSPIVLSPIDFAGLYQQKVEEEKKRLEQN